MESNTQSIIATTNFVVAEFAKMIISFVAAMLAFVIGFYTIWYIQKMSLLAGSPNAPVFIGIGLGLYTVYLIGKPSVYEGDLKGAAWKFLATIATTVIVTGTSVGTDMLAQGVMNRPPLHVSPSSVYFFHNALQLLSAFLLFLNMILFGEIWPKPKKKEQA